MELAEAKQDRSEPEEDFNDGDGGCEHPTCAVEHMIENGISTILGGIDTFVFADWEMSPYIEEKLQSFGKLLAEMFTEEQMAAIGEVYQLEPKS